MRIDNRSAAPLAALLLVGSACSLMVDPTKNDPLQTAEGACNSIQDGFEKILVRCGFGTQDQFRPYIEMSRMGCENLGVSEAAGRIGYVRSIAEQCMSRLDTASCSDLWTTLESCLGALPGKVQVGGTCYVNPYAMPSECAGGARCDSSATCPGICVAPAAANQPCATSTVVSKCVDGYYCGIGGTCILVPSTVGSPCDSTDYKCGGGLVCNYNPSGAPAYYICKAKVVIGGDCSNATCVDGAYCKYSSATTPNYRCTTIPADGSQPVGGDCYYNGDSSCQAGLLCNWTTYTCVTPTPNGGACDRNGGNNFCAEPASTCSQGVWAPTNTGICIAVKQSGQSCIVGFEECANGLYCSGSGPGNPGTCRSRVSPRGGPCGPTVNVTDPACTIAPCSVRNREYASCLPDSYCNRYSYDAPGTCQAFLGVGASCASPNYGSCGEPWTGLECGPTNTCIPNACTLAFGPMID